MRTHFENYSGRVLSKENIIRHWTREAIDDDRWNARIRSSAAASVFAETTWLDGMATNWDAIIMGDYGYVMPIAWRSRFGIRYLYQPSFTPQLGIFGGMPPSKEVMRAMLAAARDRFRFAEISLNHSNVIYAAPNADNFLLDLERGHATISAYYSENHKRNIRKASEAGLIYERTEHESQGMDPAIAFLRQQIPQLGKDDFTRLKKTCLLLWGKDGVIQRIVRSSDGKILARSLFLVDGKRIINILPFTYEAGRPLGAGHFLIDRLIEEFSGRPLILDFEGSVIPSIARFYAGFGAQAEQYPLIRWNDLPAPIRWIKPAGDPVSFLP